MPAKRAAKSHTKSARRATPKQSAAASATPVPDNDDDGVVAALEVNTARERNTAVDERVKEFAAYCKAHSKTQPDKETWEKFFTKPQMSTLWMRLKTARGRAPKSVAEAWDDLNKMGAKLEQEETKHMTLFDFLTKGGRAWQSALVTTVETISRRYDKTRTGAKKYWGELKQQHGQEEAQKLIDNGTFEQTTDSRGNVCYTKVVESETITDSRVRAAELKRTKDLDKDEAKNLEDSFDTWFSSMPTSFDDDPSNAMFLMKRPAAAGAREGDPAAFFGVADGGEPPVDDESTKLERNLKKALSFTTKALTKLAFFKNKVPGGRATKSMHTELSEARAAWAEKQKIFQLYVAKGVKKDNVKECSKNIKQCSKLSKAFKQMSKRAVTFIKPRSD